MMITQTYDLDMIPGGVPVRVAASQRDTGSRTIVFNLFNGSNPYTPFDAYARIDGTRADGETFTAAATLSGSTATWVMSLDMTAAAGEGKAELVIVNTAGNVLGSKNFVIDIEPYTRDPDVDPTTEEITIWEQMYNQSVTQAAAAQTSAAAAAQSASAASSSATAAASSASSAASAAQAIVTNADAAPTQGSSNVATSGGIYTAIENVRLTVDSTPTEGSNNPVSSGGVFSKLSKIDTIWTNDAIQATGAFTVGVGDLGYDLNNYDALYISTIRSIGDSPAYLTSNIVFMTNSETYAMINTFASTMAVCARTLIISRTNNTIQFNAARTADSSYTNVNCLPYQIIGVKF